MPRERHRCYVTDNGGSVGCFCSTNRDHDEGSMDLPAGPYWLAGLAPEGYARREQERERMTVPQDAPAPAPGPTLPAPPTTERVKATLRWHGLREVDAFFTAPDRRTYEVTVRDLPGGLTAHDQIIDLLAHEQALYEARLAAGQQERTETLYAIPTAPATPQDAPVADDAITLPLPAAEDGTVVLGNAAWLRAVRDAQLLGTGVVRIDRKPDGTLLATRTDPTTLIFSLPAPLKGTP